MNNNGGQKCHHLGHRSSECAEPHGCKLGFLAIIYTEEPDYDGHTVGQDLVAAVDR